MLRDLAFIGALVALLPLAATRPFVGVLLWSWISFMNPHQEIWGISGQLPWAALVFCATVLGCFVAGEPRRLELNATTLLVIALMVCFTVTSVTALAPPADVWAKWDHAFKALLGLLLTASLLTDRWRIHALVWMMAISIGYFGVKGGLFSIATGGAFRTSGPPASVIADNNHIAVAMLVALPLLNYLRLTSRHRLVRIGFAIVMPLTLLAVVTTYSRGALIALAAVALFTWLRSRQKLLGGIVLAGALAGSIAFMPAEWVERMNTINTYQEDASATTRLRLWEISLDLALDRPLVGSGFAGPYTREVVDRVAPGGPARAVHSIWFELLGEHGFVTFAVWLGLTLAGFYYGLRLPRLTRDRPDLAWAGELGRMGQISIVAYVVGGTFLSLSYWDYYWTITVVLGATHSLVIRTLRQGVATASGTAPAGWRSRSTVRVGDAGRRQASHA